MGAAGTVDPGALDAMAKAKTAAQLEAEAKAAATAATAAKEAAAVAARGAATELRAAQLGGKPDSVPKGSVDLWPELNLPESELAEKVSAGKCDGILTELGEMAEAHPRHTADGKVEKRGTVIEAVKARAKRAK